MDIEVLGALSVRDNGASITPTAPKPRQVLALLALHADRVVPVSALMEELWGATPPHSGRTTLQTYVLQLRGLIAVARHKGQTQGAQGEGERRAAEDMLVTMPGGYLLSSGGRRSDVRAFEHLAGLGYRAMDAGDFAGAARQLREALTLWSGTAFADVQAGPQLEIEIKRFDESRLCALEQRIEAELRLERHREVLAELTVLVNRYRTHESLHAQFMLALYRSGRRSKALEVYRRLRAMLVRDLGLEPSAGLRRLKRSILAANDNSTAELSDATKAALAVKERLVPLS